MRAVLVAVLAVAAALVLTACGGGGIDVAGPGDGSDGSPSPTPHQRVLTVSEAIESQPEGVVTVQGSIVAEADVVRLCEVVLESYPPQCGDPSLEVVGIDLDEYDTRSADGVTWTEGYVQVRGEVDGEVLRAE